MTSFPEKEKPFKCDQCSYSSTRSSRLTEHKRTHTGEKPFKCDQCSYSAAQCSALTVHYRTHTGEKPFKCDQCSYSSSRSGILIEHKRLHTGEKPFKCDQCNYSSSHCSGLTSHKRTHTGVKPFKCDQCSYSCTKKRRFIKHKRTHTCEKPFKCDHSSYSSAHCSAFTVQKRTPTDDKPFKCYECSDSFAKYFQFHEHTKTHMGFSSKSPVKVQFPNRSRSGTQNSFSLNRESENRTSSQPTLYEVPYRRMGIKSCKVKLRRLTIDQIESYKKLNSFVAIKFENEYADSIDGINGTDILGLKSDKMKLRRIKSFDRQPFSDEHYKSETDFADCVDHSRISEAKIFDEQNFKLEVSNIKTEPIDLIDRDELDCPNAAELNEFSSNHKDTSIKIELLDCDESVSIFA